LRHLASVLVGEGEAWLGDQRMPAGLALRGAGLQPLVLEAKEGLALINGTQFSTAWAALACADAERVWEAAMGAAALSTEVLLGSFAPAREDVQALRPYRGAQEAARRLREYSRGSALVESHKELRPRAGRLQPALRAAGDGRVVGRHPARRAAARSGAELGERQPARLRQRREVVSAGLFHAQPVALAADYLKIAVAEIASLSERRIDRLLDRPLVRPAGCARRLARSGVGLHDGAVHVGRTGVREQDARPPGERGFHPDRRRAGGSRQHGADRRALRAQVTDHTARVVAMELLCGCRALELRRPLKAGEGSEMIYGAVRRIVPSPRATARCRDRARNSRAGS
jgi:histidine ammonia-lyase